MPLLQLGGIARLGHGRFSNVGQHLLSSYFRGTILPSFQGATAIAAYTKKTYVSGAQCNITRLREIWHGNCCL